MCLEVLQHLPGTQTPPGPAATVQSDSPKDKGPGQDDDPHPINTASPAFISTSRTGRRAGWPGNVWPLFHTFSGPFPPYPGSLA